MPWDRGTSGGLIHPGRADVLCPSRFAELTGAAEAHNICSFPGLLAAEARGFKRGYAAGKSKNDCEINGESRTLPPPVGRVRGRSLPDAGADNNLAARTQLIASEAGSRTARVVRGHDVGMGKSREGVVLALKQRAQAGSV